MRLAARDRDIIARVGLHADASLRELAQLTGYQLHTVRHALDKMRAAGVIQKLWVIDVLALGWQRFEIFFATGCHNAKTRRMLTEYLARSSRISFLAETGGDFDYELVFLGHDSSEVTSFLEEVSKRFPEAILSRSVVIHQRISHFPRKYLASGSLPLQEISLKRCGAGEKIDSRDHAILECLSRAPEVTKRDLSRQLQLTPQTIDARLRRMKANGTIRGALLSVDAAAFGGQNFSLFVNTRGVRRDTAEALYQLARKHPHVTNFRRCFGPWDFEIGVEVLHHRDLVQLKEEIFDTFGGAINALSVSSRFKVHKYSPYPIILRDL